VRKARRGGGKVWLSLNSWSILGSLLQALGNARSMSRRGLLSVFDYVMLTMVPHRRPKFSSIFFSHFKYLTQISRWHDYCIRKRRVVCAAAPSDCEA
jgi:hypothetical protein